MIAERTPVDPILYVLNPTLYWFLDRRIGPVRVTHRGEVRAVRPVLDDEPYGRRVQVVRHGEQYRVNCFVCRDRRQQLSVNYLYGLPDKAGGRHLNLAYCHASHCMAGSAGRAALAGRLGASDNFDFARLQPWAVADAPDASGEPPEAIRLDLLPPRHPARALLRARGVDPDKVGRVYGGTYVEVGTPRIVVALEDGETRWGWWTMPVADAGAARPGRAAGKSVAAATAAARLPAYNLARARRYRTGVLVPSPLDVWAVGPMAFCRPDPLTLNRAYQQIASAFDGQTLVLMAAREDGVRGETKTMVEYFLRQMPGRFAVAQVPAAVLAGTLDRESLRKEIRRQARVQGVDVVYEPRT